MPRFGFVGPNYTPATMLGDTEVTINWRPMKMESPNARVPYILVPTAGLALYQKLGAFPTGVRGLGTFSGRTFAVAGTHLVEITGSGFVDYGAAGGNNNIVDDGLTVTMVAGGTVGGNYPSQLLICSGGTLTVFSLVSNTFQAITGAPTNVLMIDFLAGYFAALTANNNWQVSNAEDATTWSGIAISQVQVFSDQLLSLTEANGFIWIGGAKHFVAYYLSGAPLFPFDVANGGVINVGIAAQFSATRILTRAGTALAFLGGDERGGPMVYAMNGFIPQRISDSALENWLAHPPGGVISDAVGMARQEEGQNFFDLWFPTADTTWTLDVDLGWWHQRTSMVGGKQQAHLQRCHTSNFGLHLIGDRLSGNIYSMGTQYYSENTGVGIYTPIVRTRIGPTVQLEGGQHPVNINEFQVDFETGKGPIPPLTDVFGNPRDPIASLFYSEDAGKTWTAERQILCGRGGHYFVPCIDSRLGAWRSWTPKVVVSDPIPWYIADAYYNGTQEQRPRLSKTLAQIA